MTLRIGWVNDVDPTGAAGGSQMTQARAIGATPAPLEIVICTPAAVRTDCDWYVVNNIALFTKEQYEFISTRRYIVWPHDLWVTPQDWQVGEGWSRRIVEGGRRTVFLSPLHREMFIRYHGLTLDRKRTKLIPAMVDPAPFEALDLPAAEDRPGDAFWMGTFDRWRNPRAALDWAEREQRMVDFYGYGTPPAYLASSPWCRTMGEVDPDRVPATMACYRTLVTFPAEIGMDHPRVPMYVEACGRIAIEARLAGCEVISNSRLGVASWGWFNQGRDATARAMRMAPRLFWEMFMAVLLG